jgi:sulfur-oxidizing protein SoxX
MTMKTISTLAVLFLAVPAAWAAGADDTYAEFKAMMDGSFKTTGIAPKHRIYQLDFQKACSQEKPPTKAEMARIEAAQLKTIRYPADGQYFGKWQEGEKIAVNGRGLTWTDKTPHNNGGGCYNCHQMSHHEVSYGTIGPSLLEYGKVRGNAEDVVKYTWGKIYNAKAFNACSNMPRNGDAEILTEQQMKHLMAFLFDPASPVNKK